MRPLQIESIAEATHEVNRAYCESIGDHSQAPWEDAPQWQRDSHIQAVTGILNGAIQTPEQAHESWLEAKRADGWTFGEVKDVEKKTHPAFVPWSELPLEQRIKGALCRAVVTQAARMVGV